MKILAIGDIYGSTGRNMVYEVLETLKDRVDLVIANGENASHGNGISKAAYDDLTRAGIDGFTLGNHTWGCPDVRMLMTHNSNIIRPLNYEGEVVGSGSMLLKAKNGVTVGVINLIGRTYMTPCASPFHTVVPEIERLKKKTNIILVDFHAEATSEKQAMGFYLDGRVSVVFGTHTHIQTADELILPDGTGYITDLGMTGAVYSVLGTNKNVIIDRFLTALPRKFEPATGRGQFCGAIFEIDENTGKTISIERLFIRQSE